MFTDGGRNSQQPNTNSQRTNDDLNQRDNDDDLNYSVTFKTAKQLQRDHGDDGDQTDSNPYRSKQSQQTLNSKNMRGTTESLFERDSSAPSKILNDLDSRAGDSFKNSMKTRFGADGHQTLNDRESVGGEEINFELTRAGETGFHNNTISTKNSKSVKHVSFKSDNEASSPQSKKMMGGSMKTIEEETSGDFDKVKSPAATGSNKKTDMPESDLRDLALVLNEIQKRNEMVKAGLDSQITCENPKILEVLMEHIVLNWDELGEELLRDEINRM